MKNIKLKIIFSTIILAAIIGASGVVKAAPVKFKQVVQVVNAKPGKANTGSFSKLRLADNNVNLINSDGDGDGDSDKDKEKKAAEAPKQDGRVITTTISEITEDTESCECEEGVKAFETSRGGFPKWTLFGLGAVPLAFVKTEGDESPTPTPTTATPTPTTQTPTPNPPVPEPMTLLLFGTGLAGVSLAARKKFGKKDGGSAE